MSHWNRIKELEELKNSLFRNERQFNPSWTGAHKLIKEAQIKCN